MAPTQFASQTLSEQFLSGNVLAENCPSREILKHVTSRWAVLIFIALQGETLRFSALGRKIGGVSEKMLAQTLQILEADGFVVRHVYPVLPPHVDYALTPLGQEVAGKVVQLADWAELNFPQVLSHRSQQQEEQA